MNFELTFPFILDGGLGTNLIAAGMPTGVCPEEWVLDNSAVLRDLVRSFAAAGSQAVYTPTFGANRVKLAQYGLGDRTIEINKRLAELTIEATEDLDVLVGGDLAPTGLFPEPIGSTDFEEIFAVYQEQVGALSEAGVNFIGIETQMALSDMRAALLAAREVNLPTFVTMTLEENGRTLMGGSLEAAVVILQSMGAAAVGLNCCSGPDIMTEPLRAASSHARIPLIAKPNAGKPDLENPNSFQLNPEEFAAKTAALIDCGAAIFGGCCGTTPEHIRALGGLLRRRVTTVRPCCGITVASERRVFEFAEPVTISPEIVCDDDLIDHLCELCSQENQAVLIRLVLESDVGILREALSMLDIPAALACDNPAVLEKALSEISQRFFVVGNPELSERYGAVSL